MYIRKETEAMELNIKHPAWLMGTACLLMIVASGAQVAPSQSMYL